MINKNQFMTTNNGLFKTIETDNMSYDEHYHPTTSVNDSPTEVIAKILDVFSTVGFFATLRYCGLSTMISVILASIYGLYMVFGSRENRILLVQLIVKAFQIVGFTTFVPLYESKLLLGATLSLFYAPTTLRQIGEAFDI